MSTRWHVLRAGEKAPLQRDTISDHFVGISVPRNAALESTDMVPITLHKCTVPTRFSYIQGSNYVGTKREGGAWPKVFLQAEEQAEEHAIAHER